MGDNAYFGDNNLPRENDFLDLYRILGVKPDCDLTEFKHAYRQRVLVLHPDRRGDGHNDLIASERLQRLTALYGAAMKFQREHGRLPGAQQPRPADPARTPAEPGDRRYVPRAVKKPRKRSRWLVLLIGAPVAGWWLWSGSSRNPAPIDAPTPSASNLQVTSPPPTTDSRRLVLGMDSDSVRKIQGEPVMVNGDRWDYGPSWIRFENGKVVDWYSSDLQPLLNASRNPPSSR